MRLSRSHCTRYQNVELCLIDDDNAKKLVLGTKTMNVLFTSSIRLDNSQSLAVGASSTNGFIPSRSTRIFIEKRKLEEIEIMAKENEKFDGIESSEQHLLYPFDEYTQLRRLRSKFDRLSTYLCYRFSSKSTNDVRTRPWTIWTIADRSRNQDKDSSVVAASNLLKHIAARVWRNGVKVSLNLNIVTSLKRQCKQSGGIEKIFGCNEDLYGDNISIITIIGNKELNKLPNRWLQCCQLKLQKETSKSTKTSNMYLFGLKSDKLYTPNHFFYIVDYTSCTFHVLLLKKQTIHIEHSVYFL